LPNIEIRVSSDDSTKVADDLERGKLDIAFLCRQPNPELESKLVAREPPGMFGLGPVPAVKQALQRAGWDIRSIERAEINEAFAAIAIVVARELGLPEDIVNVEGGAVAHGHPIGATGAVLTTNLIHSMRRDRLTRGLVTLCIGGGQGIALAIEALH
jgi:acetyl-CoA C-acetyltransferase